MAQARAWLTLALLVVPALGGCLNDLERVPLDTGWEAQASLSAGPVALVDGRPAQLVVEGPLSISSATAVELTGIDGSLDGPNATVALSPVRLTVDGDTGEAQEAVSGNLELSDGADVRLTMVAEDAEALPLTGETWTASVELSYRYRDGPRFDAGRFTVETNLTVQPAASLGVGVARTNETGIQALVFEDLEETASSQQATVRVFHVSSEGASLETNRSAQVEPGEGVVVAQLDQPVEIREGSGYQLFRLEAAQAQGIAVTPDEPAEQPLPAPGALVAVALIALAALASRRRRS